jgi:lysozyme
MPAPGSPHRLLWVTVIIASIGALTTPVHAAMSHAPNRSGASGAPAVTTRLMPRPNLPLVAARWPLGIDVSSHQHPDGRPIDWPAVRAAGISFAFIKVDEGPGRRGRYTNPWFRADWDRARDAGVLVGPYHYARPRRPVVATADADARTFVETVGQSVRTAAIPPVLDLEEAGDLGPTEVTAWARQWLATTAALTDRTPIVYTSLWFWAGQLGHRSGLAGHPLWIARYGPFTGALPGGWTEWSFWQYTDRGRVPGIAAPVDLNVSCGSVTELVNECRARLAG